MLLLLLLICISIIFPGIGVIGSFVLALNSKKSYILYCILFALLIALPALFFIPNTSMDAFRYFYAMDIFRNYNTFHDLWSYLSGTLTTYAQYTSYPVTTFMMYLISKTGIYSLVSFITVGVGYTLTMIPFVSMFHKKTKHKYFVFILLITVLLTNHYLFYMSVFRYFLSMSIIFILLFFDKGYKKYLILYLIPVLIHPGSVFFVLIRLLYLFIKKFTFWKSIFMFGLLAAIVGLSPLLANSGISYVSYLAQKVVSYTSDSTIIEVTNVSEIAELINIIVILVFLAFLVIHNKAREKNLNIFKVSAMYSSFFVLAFIPYNDLFLRLSGVCVLLIFLFYADSIDEMGSSEKVVIFASILLFTIISIWRNLDILSATFNVGILSIYLQPIFSSLKYLPIY